MSEVFTIIVFAFILLIAYWWANQGLFSALMHCICVIISGGLAFAFWEPVVIGYLLKGSSFDNYSWGIALGLLFFLFLVITRLASDILVPFDIQLPSLPNTIGGGVVGFIAGVLTIGMALISCGFIQGPTELMGFLGWARGADSQGAPKQFNQMFLPSANWTENFYRQLSLGSMSPSGKYSMATHFPRLADTALSLHRDTFRGGDGRATIAPQDVSVGNLIFDPDFIAKDGAAKGTYAIELNITTGGYDNGEQFILSCAQTRLANTETNPKVSYPAQFRQPIDGGAEKNFTFEDIGNYATSFPGSQEVKIVLFFPSENFPDPAKPPSVFFIKGLRYVLNPAETTDLAKKFSDESTVEIVEQDKSNPDGGFLRDISDFIIVNNSIRPVQLNVNIVGTMDVAKSDEGNFLSGGTGVYKKGSQNAITRSQRISGFYHSVETEVVLVDATRKADGTGIDMWGDRSKTFKELGTDVPIELVDSMGKTTKPCGYIWERQNDVQIFFQPSKLIMKVSELPRQPSSGEHKLKLVFIVPVNSNITGIKLGKTLIGTCNIQAKGGSKD